MMQLSNESLKKVAVFLKSSSENKSFNNFRKCCYRIEDTIARNSLQKIKAYDLTLSMTNSEKQMSSTIRQLNLNLLKEQMKSRKEEENIEYEDKNDKGLQMVRVKSGLMRSRIRKSEQFEQKIRNKAVELRKLLEQTTHEFSSISSFRMNNFILNTDFLNVLKEYGKEISSATMVELRKCEMYWTSDELLQFLKIFKSLRMVTIWAEFYNPTIITNTHLELISESIEIKEVWRYKKLHFSGITSEIVDFWMKSKTKFIIFDKISTEITYSDIKKYIDMKNENAREANDNWYRQGGLVPNYGTLKFSEDDLRKIALDQRKRGFDWKVVPEYMDKKEYSVTGTGVKYSFMLEIPYKRERIDH